MAFTIQDDSGGVANANAYIAVQFFKDYHGDRGNDVSSFTDPQIEQAIVLATDYIDVRFEYVGDRLLSDQCTEWLRLDAQDIDDRVVNGIPKAVQEATAEYAFRARTVIAAGTLAQNSLNPTPDRDATGQPVKRKAERVGPIATDISFTTGDAVGSVFELPRYPVADQKLIRRGLVRSESFGTLSRGD